MLGIRLDPFETIDAAHRHGFDGVELLVRDLLDSGASVDEVAAIKGDAGLGGGTWPLPVAWRGGLDTFRGDLTRLPAYARAAEALGLDRTGTWVCPELLGPTLGGPEVTDGATFDWHVERLGAIAAILNDHGQCLGLEAIGVPSFRSRTRPVFIDRLEGLTPLIEALRDSGRAVGLVVDAFHLHASGEPASSALGLGVEAVVAVHLSDLPEGDPTDRALIRDDRRALPRPGGVAPCVELLGRLAEAGYRGPIFAEPMTAGSRPDLASSIDQIIERAADALAAVWPDATRSAF